MPPFALRLLLASALLQLGALAVVPSASAQIAYTYQTYGERGTPASGATNYLVNWPISQAECEANLPITMVVTNAPYDGTGMTRRVWDLWQGGTGTAGANCQTAANRRTVAGGTAPLCTQRTGWDGGEITNTMPTLSFRPQELFPEGCTGTAQGTYVFYVLAVSARGDTTTDVPATQFFTFSVALDFVAPAAPTVSDAAGDRQIQIDWENETTETLSGARVYVDTSAACGASTLLVEGAEVPTTLMPAGSVGGSAPTTITLDGEGLGLAIGESAPFAVTVLDLARNESVLSNVGCLERVPVSGFWDAYCAERMLTPAECRARYGSCAAQPSQHRRGATTWAALVVAGLVVVAARRRGGAR
ncbi:MAG: hypothetical protein OHK0013_39060 [Sandaracinaceae bacterium]